MISKYLLFPYWLTLKIRHFLFDKGVRKVHRSPVPTICVGNIAVGGTGKTPHTEMIVKTLLESDLWGGTHIAVLSRGHKRRSGGFQLVDPSGTTRDFGDEPLQIKKKFLHVPVALDRNRVEGCAFLADPKLRKESKRARRNAEVELPPADIIVLDDAFQYRNLQADLSIVLVDHDRPAYKDNLLPIGRLRDLPERLEKADVLIVSKCPRYMDEWERSLWAESFGLRDYSPVTCRGTNRLGRSQVLLFTRIDYCPLVPLYPEADSRYLYSKNLILFSGIAKDRPLKSYLSDKYRIVDHFKFADHHKFNALDFQRIGQAAKTHPTALVATTEKDCQRVQDYKRVPDALKVKMFQVPIEINFLSENEQRIFSALLDGLKTAPRPAL